MGTEAIKFVPITTKEGLKTYTCTENDSDGKTSVFTVIDRDKDGVITNNDVFKTSGKVMPSNKRIQQYLNNLEYKEITKTPIKDADGTVLIFDDVEADKTLKAGTEYSLGSLAKIVGAKKSAASTTETANTTDTTAATATPNTNAPSIGVKNDVLQGVLNGGYNTLNGMFMNALNTTGSAFQYQMPAFVFAFLQALDGAFTMPTYDATSSSSSTSDGSGNVDDTSSDSSSSSSASDDEYLHTDETDKAAEEEQAKLDAEEKLKADKEEADQKIKDDAKKLKEAQDKKDAEAKAAKVSELCKNLMLSMKGLNFDKAKLEAGVNGINKDNVLEVMEEWDTLYKPSMDNQSLIQSIHNDNYCFTSQTQYTNKIKDALVARSTELGLNKKAQAFNANVTYENNNPWYLGGTSNTKVEAEFDSMYTEAKAAKDKKEKEEEAKKAAEAE